MKIDWKSKLTSRKFWMAVAGFVSGIVIACGFGSEKAEIISGCIVAGASVVAYIIGEGFTDVARANKGEIENEDKENKE